MIYLPVSLLLFALLLLVLPIIWFFLTLDAVQLAATKLGFAPSTGLLFLFLIVISSTINIPLYRVESRVGSIENWLDVYRRQFLGIPFHKVPRITVVAINVGGGLLPTLLAIHQFNQASPAHILWVITIVTIVSYYAAHIVPGIGIQMNPLLAPLTAALATLVLGSDNAPAVAFAGGVLGTLIGADLLHLKDIESMSSGVLSIGGAGVFDGIVLCGLFAVLLS